MNSAERFSLAEILNDKPEWLQSLRRQVWNGIKSSHTWQKVCSQGEQLEGIESKLSRLEEMLVEIRMKLNGGSK
jgi:hypothetical protein